jgi:hypothetical protein
MMPVAGCQCRRGGKRHEGGEKQWFHAGVPRYESSGISFCHGRRSILRANRPLWPFCLMAGKKPS